MTLFGASLVGATNDAVAVEADDTVELLCSIHEFASGGQGSMVGVDLLPPSSASSSILLVPLLCFRWFFERNGVLITFILMMLSGSNSSGIASREILQCCRQP